jgi:hypothetical protein
MIPGKFFASIFGFGPKEYFEAVTGAETAPNVNLDLK